MFQVVPQKQLAYLYKEDTNQQYHLPGKNYILQI